MDTTKATCPIPECERPPEVIQQIMNLEQGINALDKDLAVIEEACASVLLPSANEFDVPLPEPPTVDLAKRLYELNRRLDNLINWAREFTRRLEL